MPPPAGAAALGSGISETMASVVSMRPAIDAAFCSAVRITFCDPRRIGAGSGPDRGVIGLIA